ncbi:glucan phosphoethanolaminetransferase (alkaline phosphatase superfamily) [Labrenzia sp. EL_126]|nr:glucan phosphoethanolaminetransferase (alkaline phosphatase superfamily) [Labrenzia sp. EL_126]
MGDSGREPEQKQLERLRKFLPALALGMAFVTFVLIKLAGYSTQESLLVAAILLTLVYGTFALRMMLGVKGFIVALFVLSILGHIIQRVGLL